MDFSSFFRRANERRVSMGHGKAGKSRNFRISFYRPRKSWKLGQSVSFPCKTPMEIPGRLSIMVLH